jgi:Na+/proline symporter
MNKIAKTALTGFGGTTVMTGGSELMSLLFGENFREPDHLETMISRLAPHLSGRAKKLAGWGAHYAMGFVFAAVYVELWETRKIKHNLKNGIILGMVSGLLGLLIWKGTFKAHPLPPWLNYTHYYLQRIPAHIIFAVAATLTYRLIKENEEPTT